MSAYPTSFPLSSGDGAWTSIPFVTMTETGDVKTHVSIRADLELAKKWTQDPKDALGITIPDPAVEDILAQVELLGKVKVIQMLWLYKEEFMKTAQTLLIKVEGDAKFIKADRYNPATPLSVKKAKVSAFERNAAKVVCIGRIHLAKCQKLWKQDNLVRGDFSHPLYEEAMKIHSKLYEHTEKSYRFALAGDRVKATKYAEKLQGDMDDIWTNMMDMTDAKLEVNYSGLDKNDKVEKSSGDWAQKGILEHIVETRKMCKDMIEKLC